MHSGARTSPPRQAPSGPESPTTGLNPYRGASVGLSDPLSRNLEYGSRVPFARKRPASESPPNASKSERKDHNSPSQRADVMSMSSILGPSTGHQTSDTHNLVSMNAEKRRRVDGPMEPADKVENSSIDVKLSGGTLESAAANLARRKWSGPIAEEAAQQAAMWRAQEQRWGGGSSRSPRVGMVPLSNNQHEGRTPPFASTALPSRSSPSYDGHRRQRSDGVPIPSQQLPHVGTHMDTRSPLGRPQPLRVASPPPQSTFASHARSPSSKTYSPQQGFYRNPSPVPQMQHQQALPRPPLPSAVQSGPPQPIYGQPNYHAYDSQGRPVEIDVDEVRGGAFAGHGNPTPMMESSYHHGISPLGFEDHHRGPPQRPSTSVSTKPGGTSASQPPAPQHAHMRPTPPQQFASLSKTVVPPSHPDQAPPPRKHVSASREREHRGRRSLTPVVPGPAKGLLPPALERARGVKASHRPLVPAKDFNEGPRVDNEAVFKALKEFPRPEISAARDNLEGEKGEGLSKDSTLNQDKTGGAFEPVERDAFPPGRHLGSFLYEPRRNPLLPGEMLRRNIGAVLEVRISGQTLGLGPTFPEYIQSKSRWSLGTPLKDTNSKGDLSDGQHNSDSGVDPQAYRFWEMESLLKRRVWGTDVYTDDSDVVAMCLHSGRIKGPQLGDVPSWVPPGKAVKAWRKMTKEMNEKDVYETPSASTVEQVNYSNPKVHSSPTCDLSVLLRVAPKLIAYKGSQRGGVRSRSWGNTHDGVSLIVEDVLLKPPGYASGDRGLRNTKQRIDQLARLKLLATVSGDARTVNKNEEKGTTESVLQGHLIDIVGAANVREIPEKSSQRNFWHLHVDVDTKAEQ